MVPEALERAFFAGERTETVLFVLNDSVRVVSGTHDGRLGSVIALLAVDPRTEYLVEFGSPPFGEASVLQDHLEGI